MGEEKIPFRVGDVLKNALHWKQWMANDLRVLIQMGREEGLDKKSLQDLITHHLKTYDLVNQTFVFITGDNEDKLFDLPNIDYLQEILPSLSFDRDELDDVIEPMLELELESLSGELKDETIEDTSHNAGVNSSTENSSIDPEDDSNDQAMKTDSESDGLNHLEVEPEEQSVKPEDITDAFDGDEYNPDLSGDDIESIEDTMSESIVPKQYLPLTQATTDEIVSKLWSDISVDTIDIGHTETDVDNEGVEEQDAEHIN